MAGKTLKPFINKTTGWEGLWWHPEKSYFSSCAINLAKLKEFKGSVRLFVRKNKQYNGGENGRPNYLWWLQDTSSEAARDIRLDALDSIPDLSTTYYAFTRKELHDLVNSVAEYVGGSREYGNHLIEDYMDISSHELFNVISEELNNGR